jgi:4-hydroxy-3-methylbut-2-enyl diphosphate reductase
MIVQIDKNAGFCFGVEDAINIAESKLKSNNKIYCLGDIVHNDIEVNRLKENGIEIIDKSFFKTLKNTTVLFRAHGESPSSFEIAQKNNIEVIDATCPIVKKLQERVKKAYNDGREEEQIIIYGQIGHAESIALLGQINNNGIIIESINDLSKIDFNKPITIFSQTTKSNQEYLKIVDEINKNINLSENKYQLIFNKTVCKQVANRDIDLKEFAKKHELIIFVSGTKSSNGKMLYNVCKSVNNQSYFVSNKNDIQPKWFNNVKSVGISGATSTPKYQLAEIKEYIADLLK